MGKQLWFQFIFISMKNKTLVWYPLKIEQIGGRQCTRIKVQGLYSTQLKCED